MKKSEALRILGLSEGYSEDDIKKAHRQKIRENHPDQFTDAKKKSDAEEKTKLINEARDVLVNRRWDPEYGPRTGYSPYGNPYSNPYSSPYGGNPFAGYGGPYSYRPGGSGQGGSYGGGQNPFEGGFPFDFVWTTWDGATRGGSQAGNPFDPFSTVFTREPSKTAAQKLEENEKSLRLLAIMVLAKIVILAVCTATGALPVGVSIYAIATAIFALFHETSGCSRVIAVMMLALFGPVLVRLLPLALTASMSPLAVVFCVASFAYDVKVLRSALLRYRASKAKAGKAKVKP